MASANIYSIADPPPIEYIPNNQGGQDIECLNYVFNRKTLGRKTASYDCTGCCASISLKTVVLKVEDKEVIQIVEPFVITHLNLNHKGNCMPKTEQQLEVKSFLHKVKDQVEKNPYLPTNPYLNNNK